MDRSTLSLEDAIEKNSHGSKRRYYWNTFYNRMWKEDDSGIVEVIDLAMTNARICLGSMS